MGQDISAELAGEIGAGKVFGSSENIRHGIYTLLIKTIRGEKVEVEGGTHRFVFWEMSPTKSEPNPQTEGDRIDYVSAADRGTGPLKDDGTTPNAINSDVALKVDFDGPGARSAAGNSKAPILALFNKADMSEADTAATWIDLSRQKPLRKGEAMGFDQATKQVIYATEDKQAQPARGMLIGCKTVSKKKGTANDNGAYITKLIFFCIAPIGEGVNSKEEVARRRAEIEANGYGAAGDDEADEAAAASANGAGRPQMPVGAPSGPPAGGMSVSPTPPQAPPPPSAPPAPPAPPVAPWTVPAGWTAYTDPAWFGATPDTRWYHNAGVVKNEAQLRAGQ